MKKQDISRLREKSVPISRDGRRARILSLSLLLQLHNAWRGLNDSLAIPLTLFVLYGSTTLQRKMLNCVIMNGVVIFGSILMQHYVIGPLITWIISGILFWVIPSSQKLRARWVTEQIVHSVITLIWIIPLFLLSFYLNGRWYQEIANRSFEIFVGNIKSDAQNKSKSVPSMFRGFVQEVYRFVFLATFLAQTSLSYYIPIIGPCVSFALYCFVTSYYAFECVWTRRGLGLKQRVRYFETNWAYFGGFGLPCSLATFFLSPMVSQSLFALIYPLLIIMATRATPRLANSTSSESKISDVNPAPNLDDNHVIQRLPIFWSSEFFANALIGWIKDIRQSNEIKLQSSASDTTKTQ